MDLRAVTPGIQLALRASAAAALSVVIAELFQLEYPIYAFIAAVIVTDLNPSESRKLGVRRIVATGVGAVCGAVLSPVLAPGPSTIGISVLVAMLASQLLQASDGAKVAGYICGIVVLDHSSEPWAYALHRSIETVMGIGVAWAVSYMPKLIPLDD